YLPSTVVLIRRLARWGTRSWENKGASTLNTGGSVRAPIRCVSSFKRVDGDNPKHRSWLMHRHWQTACQGRWVRSLRLQCALATRAIDGATEAQPQREEGFETRPV